MGVEHFIHMLLNSSTFHKYECRMQEITLTMVEKNRLADKLMFNEYRCIIIYLFFRFFIQRHFNEIIKQHTYMSSKFKHLKIIFLITN